MPQDAQWNVLYEAAMLELDPARLRANIEIARSAIERRIQELRSAGTHDNGNSTEMQRIADALNSLRTLERLECKTPGIGNNEAGTSTWDRAS
jgi:hypothetical protein